MSVSLAIWLAIIGFGVVAALSWREHRHQRARRRDLFDDCAALLRSSIITHGGDDFPRLEGIHNGHHVRAELIADTMTIRRLPQLWLSLTKLESRRGIAEFAVLVRPAGTEFYAVTPEQPRRLQPPAGFPDEVSVRGSSPASQNLIDRVAPVIEQSLRDGRVKEIAVTTKGLRIVWQAAEGRRGEHLLLRQATFDDARVRADMFAMLLARLDELSGAVALVSGSKA